MHKSFYLIGLICTMLTVSACTVGPVLENPHPTLTNTWRNQLEHQSTLVGKEPWWNALHQPSLSSLIQKALDQNLDIQQAVARYDQASAYVQASNSTLYPSANLNGAAGRLQQSQNAGLGTLSRFVPGVNREVDIAQINIGATWELDFAGGLKKQKLAYQQNAKASLDEIEAVRLLISAEVADAFIQISGLQEARLHLSNSIKYMSDSLNINKVRFELGEIPASEYQFQVSELQDLRSKLPILESQIEQQRNRLVMLLGQSASTTSLDIPLLGLTNELSGVEQGVPGDILRYRPDIRAAEARLVASNALIGASIAEYYPKLSLSGIIGQDSNKFSSLGESGSSVIQGLVGLRWRLFDFGRVDAQVKQATAKHKEQWLAYQQLVIKASADAESALYNYKKMQETEQLLQSKKIAYMKTLNTAKVQLDSGDISRLSWLQKKLGAELIDRQIAMVQLELAQSHIQAIRVLGVPEI